MKLVIKENGKEKIIKEGGFDEIKIYLLNDLDALIDWAKEEGNIWNDFNGMKNEIIRGVNEATKPEETNEALDEFNKEISWWSLYIKNKEMIYYT